MKQLNLILPVLLILSLIIPGAAWAVDENVKEGVLITRAMIQADRTQMVLNTLRLSGEEIKAFSPVYLDYWEELNLLNDGMEKLILDYSDNYKSNNLTDEKALGMLDDYLDFQKKKVALRKKFVKKFKKVLTPKKLVQYYQIENKMDAIIMVELAREIPLVK
jgi:hypothetical protein